MGNLFGSTMTPEEMLKNSQKQLRNNIRILERECRNMQLGEQKIIAEIKQSAYKNQMSAVKALSKELIRTRNATAKFYGTIGQLKSVSIRIRTIQSTAAMKNAMRDATKAMYLLNKQIDNKQLQQIMMTFERENEYMDIKQELMDDTIDGIMSNSMDDEQEEELISQIMDEIGIEITKTLDSAPTNTNTKIHKTIKL